MSKIDQNTKKRIYKALKRGESNGRIRVWWGLTDSEIAAFKANLTRNPKLAK
jgi:hypothetical protein